MGSDVWRLLPGHLLGPPEIAARMAAGFGAPTALVDSDGTLLAHAPTTDDATFTTWWAGLTNPVRILATLPRTGAYCWLGERQVYAVPITAEDHVVGYSVTCAGDGTDETEWPGLIAPNIQLLGEYLSNAGVARRSLVKLARLAELAGVASANGTGQTDGLAFTAGSLSLVRGAISAYVGLVDEATGGIRFVSIWGQHPGVDFLQPGEGFSGWVLREGQPLVITDLAADPRVATLYRDRSTARLLGARSLAIYPLKGDNVTFGVLGVVRDSTEPFTSDSLYYLAVVAGGLSAVLYNQRLADRLQRQFRRMGAVAEVARVLALSESDDRVYALLAEMAALLLPEPAAVLALMESGTLVARGVHGVDADAVAAIIDRLVQHPPRPPGEWSPIVLNGERVIHAFPLHGQRGLLGYLALPLRRGRATDFDLHIFGAVARTASSALTQRLSLQGAAQAAVDTFVRLIAAREVDSGLLADHSGRVTETAHQIATRLGLGAAQLQSLTMAGRLHDLGLCLIGLAHSAAEVAAPTPPLAHAAGQAGTVLERFWGLGSVAASLRYLREWFDGRGGPTGIAGESIPLTARILAVAEYYDLLLLAANGWESGQALRAVEALAGSAFDPLVVQTLNAVVLGVPTPARPEAPEGLGSLTTREREVLECVARGLGNRAIAATLFISEATVKVHLGHIFKKLGITDRTKAALYLKGHRIIS